MNTENTEAPLLDALRALESQIERAALDNSELNYVVTEFCRLASYLAYSIRQLHEHQRVPGSTFSLAHYTSLDVMYKILSAGPEGVFRLYDSVHVNDPREGAATPEGRAITDALSSITEALGFVRSFSGGAVPPIRYNAARFSTAYIWSLVGAADRADPGDDLDFWRSYGRDGRGCSLTFFPFLSGWPAELLAGLRNVHYGIPESPDYSKETMLLLRIHNALSSVVDHLPDLASLLKTIEPSLDECFARRFLIKDSAYASEKEVRFVVFPNDRDVPHYHLANGQIRHYLELSEFKLESLLSSTTILRVGPAVPHADDTLAALQRIWFQKWGKSSVPSIQVRPSLIPYRSTT